MESNTWKNLKKQVKYGKMARIENLVYPGFPDVFFVFPPVCGFIELKYKASWPKRESTPVRLRHFTPQQKLFFKEFGSAGVPVYLLLQIGKDFFLLPWMAALACEYWTKEDFFDSGFEINMKTVATQILEDYRN